MTSTVRYQKPRVRNPAVQALGLRALFPEGRVRVGPARLTWEGDLTPTALSRTYKVRIHYQLSCKPEITVLSPALEVPPGTHLPHTYSGDELCLYFPGQWDGSQLFVDTVVPWSSEWLLHYEIWKITGRWTGGGHEPFRD